MKIIALLMVTLIGGLSLAKDCTSCLTAPTENTKHNKPEKGTPPGDTVIQRDCTSC